MAKSQSEELASIQQMIEQSQKAYFRLSVQVSVSTAILTISAFQQFSTATNEGLLFLTLLLAGHLAHLFSPPQGIKILSGILAISGGIGTIAVDPSGATASTFIGAGAGAFSGSLHFLSVGVDTRSAMLRTINRILALRMIYNIDEYLMALNWKRRSRRGVSVSGTVRKLEQKKHAVYFKGRRYLQNDNITIDWPNGLQEAVVVIKRRTEQDKIEKQEARAIKDFVAYQGKLYDYFESFAQHAALPLELAEGLAKQVPTLLNKYRHPENYVNCKESGDIVEKMLGWHQNMPKRPIPQGEELQAVLLAYNEVQHNLKALVTAKAKSTERWKEFTKRLDLIRNADVPSDYTSDFNDVLKVLEYKLEEAGLNT